MWSTLVVATLSAAPSVKLGTMPFQHAGMAPEAAALVQDALVNRLASNPGVAVVTTADIAAALGLERQKRLLGCAEEAANCIAELAGALGVDGLLTGSIGRVGNSFQLNAKVVSAKDARSLFVYASKPLASEGALLEEAATVADLIAARLVPATPGASAAAGWPPWLLVGGGVLVAGGGAVFAGLAGASRDALAPTNTLPAGVTPEQVRDQGKLYLGLGVGLLAAGSAMALSGVIWKLAAPRAPVAAGVWVGPDGGAATVLLELP